MEPAIILYAIIGITVLSYLFNEILDLLNLKAQRRDLPDEITSFYDKEKYLKSLDYQREKTHFGFITSAFSFVLSLLMLIFGGFGMLDGFLRPLLSNEIVLALVFFGTLTVVSDILTLPFQWHSIFVIEEKFGFNKTTVKTFITDKLKGYVLGAVIGGALVSALIYLIEKIGTGFWIWFGIIAAVFILLVNMFYTSLLLPLFNKLTPLAEGELKTTIE
ncbi:MAG TPA: M48 family peptidase, partial [Cyclobacteriaceae bacterium]|nr:M48 family peptidase [Cyclobacteriaceae bacterium]